MPGDELPDSAAAGARTGPRHAAPRKPLLTRLHVPAGKAIAIAAMPSAVLMGMGLTPQMAIAKPAPKSPFKDGPCVTAPDKVDGKDAGSKDGAADKKDDAQGKDDAKPSGEPSASPSAGKDAGKAPEPAPSGSSKTDEPSGSATPSPSSSEEKKDDGGLLGGIGDALGGLLGDKSKDDDSSASPSPSASEPASPSPSPSASKDSGSATDKVTKPVTDTVGGLKDGADKAGDAVKNGSKTVNDTVHGAVGAADNALPGGGLDGKDASGKKSFPCVVENKQKGKAEQTPATLPDDPWHLESSALTLRGLNYEGVVNVQTQNGHTKQALKFTADSVDIGDLHQIVDDPTSGKHYHVQGAPGSTSTIRGGKVTMYTERLQGNLFGLIPIVFDPEHPPPINVPFAYFTKVKIDQAGQFGGNLHIPGLHQSITD
ncbi:hypothetical protein SAMN05428945_0293 [Streptomyces sp. 2224.1]|nr:MULTISPECIES: hypothetical protein [unclassified Streptomyces]PBC85134.1 hypothetical protein BX261_5135 [Streptomyces sp. 2321.6]SDR21466.1 hypothetical protein SAMN05216511_2125 [Streptomyces sp. KS_16]SEB53473.1 hypothetical protein SAMN05428945_0293 [Streptomyces sp. 2224.1]SED57056.1 hypothetical protein SAMN05428940_5162 [Streptomyces sp. 2133.1]SEE27531.1 hypothetical protein SAMN05428954_2202 [Streptomyces sp. 2112.3]